MSWSKALTEAFTDVLGRMVGSVPGLLGVLFILVLGWIAAKVLRRAIVAILLKIGFDGTLEKAGVTKIVYGETELAPSIICGKIIYWVVMITVFIGIANYLNLPTVSEALNSLLLFIPNILSGIAIIVLAFVLGNFLAGVISEAAKKAEIARSDLLGNIAKYAIVILASAMALEQLRIETAILKLALTYFVGALAVAVALAFGLGCTTIAKDVIAFLLVRDRFQVEQRIKVDEYSGKIDKISLTSTVLDTDKGLVNIPNSVLLEKVIIS